MIQIPAQVTKLTLDQAIEAFFLGFLSFVGVPPTVHALSILVAQSALETGNWHQAYCYNFGNARPGPHTAFYCEFKCGEFVHGRQVIYTPPDERCKFRAFRTAAEGIADHLDVLSELWPEAWSAAMRGEAVEFVQLLKHQPAREPGHEREYFTAPLLPYVRAVSALQAQYFSHCESYLAGRASALVAASTPAPDPVVDVNLMPANEAERSGQEERAAESAEESRDSAPTEAPPAAEPVPGDRLDVAVCDEEKTEPGVGLAVLKEAVEAAEGAADGTALG